MSHKLFHKFRLIFFLLPLLLVLISSCTSMGIRSIPDKTLKEKYCDKDSRFITVDGITYHYKDEGQGPVIIMIHGVCASLHTWDGWVERMKDRYRIIRLDLPGFGFSSFAGPNGYNRESAVKMMESLNKAIGIERFSLVGNSLGGYVAWLYAYTFPEKVDKLILVDPVGQNMDLPPLLSFASNPVVRPFSRRMMPRFIFDMAVNQVYGDKSKITNKVKDRYFELAMRENSKSNYVDVFTSMKKESHSPALSKGISDIKVPTLVMWGTKDIWIDYNEHFQKWKKSMPNASFIAYEGAGHIPMEEIPDVTARDALEFLKR